MARSFFFCILFYCFVVTAKAQINRAFIVAIDRYPEYSGWEDINSVNDTRILVPMLLQHNFEEENISILTNAQATKKEIIAGFENLYRQTGKGDYIYIHFSCHGQQMIDDNGDEDDGLDESIITYDATRWYKKGIYEGEKHLRDDELGEYLTQIRSRAGNTGNVIVVLDACHSGTGVREGDDKEFIRGTSYIFGPPNHELVRKKDNINLHLEKGEHLASVSVFSACQANEKNYEYKDKESGVHYGSLSYAFCKLISNWNRKASYVEFHKQLINEYKLMFGKRQRQTPYFESTDNETILKIGR